MLFVMSPYPTYETEDINLRTNLVYEYLRQQYYEIGMRIYRHY